MIFPPELAILHCGVSDNDLKAVTQVFNDLRPLLGVSTDTAVESCSLTSAKSYLLKNTLRFCVLVVDGKTVKDVYERSVSGRAEYDDLLRTAANKVGKRDSPSMLKLYSRGASCKMITESS